MEKHKEIIRIVRATEDEELQDIIKTLRELATSFPVLPSHFLLKMALALEDNDYTPLSSDFRNQKFIGKSGDFLLIAPYTTRRGGKSTTRLSAIFGKVISHRPLKGVSVVIEELFSELRQPISSVLPVDVYASAGLIGGRSGEAFVVPNGWAFPNNEDGPALNDMNEQRRRFRSGYKCISRIFESQTAELITSPFQNKPRATQIQQFEYQLHDAGHASGIGLSEKLRLRLLNTHWYRAVEEWRADGVAFTLAQKSLSSKEAAQILCSNLCTRFGVDAHRAGGINRDADVCASLILIHSLLENHALKTNSDGKLALANPTFEGLLHALQPMSRCAIALTCKEMALDSPQGIWRLYGTIPVSADSTALFQEHVVKPCHGMFNELP